MSAPTIEDKPTKLEEIIKIMRTANQFLGREGLYDEELEEAAAYLQKMNDGEICQVVKVKINDGTVSDMIIQANVAVLAHIMDYDIDGVEVANLKKDDDGNHYIPIQAVFVPKKTKIKSPSIN